MEIPQAERNDVAADTHAPRLLEMNGREVTLPNAWRPRPHQRSLWDYLEGGGRRAVAVWHRRAGKDSTAINWTAVAAHQRIGTY